MKNKETMVEEVEVEVQAAEEMVAPTDEQLQEWADTFKKVFKIDITEEDTYYFRTLNRKEYKELASVEMDQLEKEESLCEICVLWPSDYNSKAIENGLAGAPTIIAEYIMRESGFNTNCSPVLL